MPSSLITGAVAVLLILITGYVVVGGIITISETTFNTQAEMIGLSQKFLKTNINILYSEKGSNSFLIGVANNGSTSFGGADYGKMDLFIGYVDNTMDHETLTSSLGNDIINDRTNRKMWDESEIVNISRSGLAKDPAWVKIVTPNGIAASTNL